MALVTTQSNPVEDRRALSRSPRIRGDLRPVSAAEKASQLPVRRWRAFALLVVAYFMTIVDFTIVNVALPTIGGQAPLPRVRPAVGGHRLRPDLRRLPAPRRPRG